MNKCVYAFFGQLVDTESRLQAIKSSGFNMVGIWLGEDMRLAIPDDEHTMLQKVTSQKLEIAYADTPFEYSAFLSNSVYGLGEALGKYKGYIRTSTELGCPIISLKPTEINPHLAKNLDDLAFFAEKQGKVKIALENGEIYDFAELFEIIPSLGFSYNTKAERDMGLEEGELLARYKDKLTLVKLVLDYKDFENELAVAKIKSIADKLKRIDYNGIVSVYIDSDEEIEEQDKVLSLLSSLLDREL